MGTHISDYDELLGANVAVDDYIEIVDRSDISLAPNGKNSYIEISELLIGLGALPKAGGTMTGPLTSTIGTITVNTPALSATQTWNDAGVTFKGIFLNVTNTASAAGSRLLDLQVGGSSKMSLSTGGVLTVGTSTISEYTGKFYELVSFAGRIGWDGGNDGTLGLWQLGHIKWSSDNTYYGTPDLALSRNAAGILEVNNGTAGTFRDIKCRYGYYEIVGLRGNGTQIYDNQATESWALGGAGAQKFFLNSSSLLVWSPDSSYATAADVGLVRNATGIVEVNSGTAGVFRDILVRSVIIDGAPSSVASGKIAIGADTRTTIGANGAASALTANPLGYIDIDVGGTTAQIPYYNRGA